MVLERVLLRHGILLLVALVLMLVDLCLLAGEDQVLSAQHRLQTIVGELTPDSCATVVFLRFLNTVVLVLHPAKLCGQALVLERNR